MLLPCAGAARRAAALASPHHGQSTRRLCNPLCRAHCCWERERCFWAPAGPGGQLWSLALCLKERKMVLLVCACYKTIIYIARNKISVWTFPHLKNIWQFMVIFYILRLTNEGFPGLGVLALPPGMRPAHHNSIRFHPSQATGLNHVTDAFTRFLSYNTLREAFHSLLFHQVLQSLTGNRGE